MAAYRAALLTGVAHDEMGCRRGALFFYQKCRDCSEESIRPVGYQLVRSVTEEVSGDSLWFI